ncbi:hypothetical protein GCM10025864_12500 [Luteimicrobium album]|uniref:Uncharacterized protein n=1 Tax=Luteimicrobium album TaxID=1054550 RepID=A0ABQ6HZS1_9MICO|nr:hypothetical protein [Luteimicrobium album]GMA23491.1 hypothetical protein GCM10025864_12500 [Luteimicrobium album]
MPDGLMSLTWIFGLAWFQAATTLSMPLSQFTNVRWTTASDPDPEEDDAPDGPDDESEEPDDEQAVSPPATATASPNGITGTRRNFFTVDISFDGGWRGGTLVRGRLQRDTRVECAFQLQAMLTPENVSRTTIDRNEAREIVASCPRRDHRSQMATAFRTSAMAADCAHGDVGGGR